ncbi:MAG: hypothetical protein AAF518_20215, partial [Spirochaetota bacterium]
MKFVSFDANKSILDKTQHYFLYEKKKEFLQLAKKFLPLEKFYYLGREDRKTGMDYSPVIKLQQELYENTMNLIKGRTLEDSFNYLCNFQ